jgi:hypothetical protein
MYLTDNNFGLKFQKEHMIVYRRVLIKDAGNINKYVFNR